jgi:hypothetical protein
VHNRVKYRVDAKPAEVVTFGATKSSRMLGIIRRADAQAGRLRNSALFNDWDLPTRRWAICARLQDRVDGVGQFVKIRVPEGDGVIAMA